MPREKTMKVVFAFPTTTMAMKMEAAAKAKEAPGRLIPVPKADQRRLWNGLVRTGCGQSFSGAADRYGTDRNRGLL